MIHPERKRIFFELLVENQPLFLFRLFERIFFGGASMNHFLSEKYLFPFTKNDPYVTMKGVKPKAYLGNRIREQFDVFEKSFEHSKGVF